MDFLYLYFIMNFLSYHYKFIQEQCSSYFQKSYLILIFFYTLVCTHSLSVLLFFAIARVLYIWFNKISLRQWFPTYLYLIADFCYFSEEALTSLNWVLLHKNLAICQMFHARFNSVRFRIFIRKISFYLLNE